MSRRDRWVRRAAAVASGIVLALARPPADIGWLVLVGLVPLLWLWRDDSPRGAAGHGFLAGVAYHAIVVSWTWYFGSVAIVALVGALAGYWALVGLAVAWLRRRAIATPWLTAALWVVAEGAVARFPLHGFSWGELGYAAHDIAPLRALAALGGLPLVSYVVVLVNAALVDLACAWRGHATRALLRATTVLGVGALVTAVWFVAWPTTPVTGYVHVALVQGNDLNRDLTERELDERYLPRSHFALAATLEGRYDLVVFPESSLDDDPRKDPFLEQQLVATARRLHTSVLANATTDADPAGNRALNLDVLYSPQGQVIGTYAKRHLVPFGEYVPMRSFIEHFVSAVNEVPRDFVPGTTPGLLRLAPGADGKAHEIASLICFESAFGYQVRPLVHDGAQLIVVSTNNRSYRRSANSWQHVAIGQLRAAETGRAVLQASISGHSAVIDARGRVLSHTELFHNGVLTATVATRGGMTPYVRFGDWALGAALLASVAALATAWAMRRKHEARTDDSVDSQDDPELVRGAV
jgi:apolipoprotein N-acyltransferase